MVLKAPVLELFPEQLTEKPESFGVLGECGRVAGSDCGHQAPTYTDQQVGASEHQLWLSCLLTERIPQLQMAVYPPLNCSFSPEQGYSRPWLVSHLSN